MYPSKSTMEYMSEINRLFPRPEDDPPFSLSTYQSPFQLAMVNRSSSSADSTSPESYPDVSFNRLPDFHQQLETPRTPQENPFTIRRQRAIVGRKILGRQPTQTQMSPVEKNDEFNFWQPEELPETPPGSINQSNSVFYELFPSDNNIRIKSPVKSESQTKLDLSPRLSNFTLPSRSPMFLRSQDLSDISPPSISGQAFNMLTRNPPNPPQSLLSANWSNSHIPATSQGYPANYNNPPSRCASRSSNTGASSSKLDDIGSSKVCTFCRKNGEAAIVYMTHCVKERVGNKNVVTCPILRSYVCATCGSTGDDAHTILKGVAAGTRSIHEATNLALKSSNALVTDFNQINRTYCPVLRSTNNGKPLQSTTITLKNTRIKSNGRRRY